MIVVRVELWPGGDSRPLRQIAILGIVNIGPEGDGRHAYEARLEGRIARLAHAQADGALALVARAIDALAEGSEADPRARLDDADALVPRSAVARTRSDQVRSASRSDKA